MSNSLILKEQTKGLHDSVERVMNSELLFSNQFTVDHYKNFILKSYDYVALLSTAEMVEWDEYKKLLLAKKTALVADLENLNITPSVNTNTNFDFGNKYYQLGLIYIVLGAMLGNKIILSKLQQTSGFESVIFSYLSEHQQDLSSIWKNFQQYIDQLTQSQLNDVILGAKTGYSLFGH
jgi:heme oxygenase